VCEDCRDRDARRASADALRWLAGLAEGDLAAAGRNGVPPSTRGEGRALLYGFAEYHLERRMRSLPLLASTKR
jgi:hypothetical protein